MSGPTLAAVPTRRDLHLDAYVTGVVFLGPTPVFACGNGQVHIASPGGEAAALQIHAGPILALAAAPGGGILSGGDDGQMVHTTPEGRSTRLHHAPGRWIGRIAVSAASGAVACAAGREAIVFTGALTDGPTRIFGHATTVSGLGFDPKGKRLAASHYGGVSLWWLAAESAQPQTLGWKGSHIDVTYAPNGLFVVSSMQENALHGWRLADKANLRMTGYPSKVKSWTWLAKGRFLATSGSARIVLWPFDSKSGPMGKAAQETGPETQAMVTQVAAHPRQDMIAAGYSDGSVRLVRAFDMREASLRPATGAAVSALAWSEDGQSLAFGDSEGAACVIGFPAVP